MPDCYAILGDIQSPYHDRDAVDVACQICSEAKPKTLVLNGDIWDCRKIGGLRYPSDDGARDTLISQLAEEGERTGTLVRHIVKRIGAKTNVWLDGNHEYRIWRAMMQSPQTVQLMGFDSVRDATSAISLLGLDDLKFKYIGHYPKGFWLLGEGVAREKNCWIEHGYIVRQKAGYTASALLDKRMSNVICGHVERLTVIRKRVNGPKEPWHLFAAEGGNLSAIGEPGKGEDIYTGIPHSVPEYMDHQQGFLLLYHDNGDWWVEEVHINKGRAVWRGKLYTAKPSPQI